MAAQAHITRRSFVRGLPLATVAASLPALALNADAVLIALGHTFEAAFAEEEKARQIGRETDSWAAWDAANSRTMAIVSEIERHPAVSLQGFRVKARAIRWCYGDDPVDLFDHGAIDARLAAQIVAELLA